MSQKKFLKRTVKILVPLGIFTLLLYWAVGPVIFPKGYSLNPGRRSLYMSTNEVSATAEYLFSFYPNVSSNIGSIEFQFCSNDPLPGTPCTPPAGFDASAANLIDQTGSTGFSISNISTSNRIVISRTPTFTLAGNQVTYHFNNIVNPSSSGAYYVRLQAFATTNATGPASDYGGIAFNITNLLTVTATVPPFLTFCTGVTITGLNCANANGNYINFGELSSKSTKSGSSQMLAATNAQDGYNVTVLGSTLVSGTNSINPLAANDVSRPGTSQFGMNLSSNSAPAVGSNPIGPGVSGVVNGYNQSNFYRFNSGETIITYPKPNDVQQYTASYIVNVPNNQAAGVYVSTLTYICLATF